MKKSILIIFFLVLSIDGMEPFDRIGQLQWYHAIFSYNDIGQKSLALRENFETSTLEDLGLESLLKDYHIPIIQKVEEAIQRKNYLASHGDVVLII